LAPCNFLNGSIFWQSSLKLQCVFIFSYLSSCSVLSVMYYFTGYHTIYLSVSSFYIFSKMQTK
jgi:hypothetical protein